MSDDLDFTNLFEELSGDENSEKLFQPSRLRTEWITLVALRDMLGFALKGAKNGSATYRQALAIGRELIPQLFDPEVSLLNKQKLSETARKYMQMAEASSEIEKKDISPIDLLSVDIDKYQKYLEKENFTQDMGLLRKELNSMIKALQELQKIKTSENSLIFRDAYQVQREYPISGRGKDYREFKVSDERALRVRVLHPDKPEYVTGADLIYEHYWIGSNIKFVRLAALQYKIWNNKTLYIDPRMKKQLEKLEMTFCNESMCAEGDDNRRKGAYRLPYCTAFLRPSDDLQSEDSSFLSSGYYVPVCIVKKWQRSTSKGSNLHSKDVRSEAVTHKVFEEMFNTNMLGSRWLTFPEIKRLYLTSNLLEVKEHIIIHAQDVPFN